MSMAILDMTCTEAGQVRICATVPLALPAIPGTAEGNSSAHKA